MDKQIGITTTIPVEVVFAAGDIPIDLNNIFITDEAPGKFIDIAENAGFPRNMCNWVKGIFGVIASDKIVDQVIAVTQGDCSNTQAMMEILQYRGVPVLNFDYPYDRDPELMQMQINKLIRELGTTWEEVADVKEYLDTIRRKLAKLDELTWNDNIISGEENHLWLINSSDFNSNPESFEQGLDKFLRKAEEREPFADDEIRLGFCGVPPIFTDLYTYLESKNARVIYNEVQRQFSMPFITDDIVDQYLQYTYPYDIFGRLEDLKKEIERRNIQGLIHYVQSFCHRQMQDMIIREEIGIPIITLEGDRPLPLDARTKLRLDTFVEMLR